jgi:hypothetical protein
MEILKSNRSQRFENNGQGDVWSRRIHDIIRM